MNDREPLPGSPAVENRAANTNPNSAKQCLARSRSPRNNQPCACGNSGPAAPTVRPSSARNKAGKPSRRKRQNRRRSELPEAGRKTHVPANAASRTRSQSDRLADRPRDPSSSANSRPAPLRHTEPTKPDFVNGLLEKIKHQFVCFRRWREQIFPADRACYEKVIKIK